MASVCVCTEGNRRLHNVVLGLIATEMLPEALPSERILVWWSIWEFMVSAWEEPSSCVPCVLYHMKVAAQARSELIQLLFCWLKRKILFLQKVWWLWDNCRGGGGVRESTVHWSRRVQCPVRTHFILLVVVSAGGRVHTLTPPPLSDSMRGLRLSTCTIKARFCRCNYIRMNVEFLGCFVCKKRRKNLSWLSMRRLNLWGRCITYSFLALYLHPLSLPLISFTLTPLPHQLCLFPVCRTVFYRHLSLPCVVWAQFTQHLLHLFSDGSSPYTKTVTFTVKMKQLVA